MNSEELQTALEALLEEFRIEDLVEGVATLAARTAQQLGDSEAAEESDDDIQRLLGLEKGLERARAAYLNTDEIVTPNDSGNLSAVDQHMIKNGLL